MNTCICGDCLAYMRSVKDPFIDLAIADPPFNIKFKYDSYNDDRPLIDYLQWCREWISELKRLIYDDGNILICSDDTHVADIDVIAQRDLGLKRQDWLIWHYGFGQSGKLESRRKFTKSKTHVLRYVKGKKFFFDPISVAVPSARALKYSDKRADPRGKCPDDVFEFKRVAGTHKERVHGINTQMPIGLLKTWIKAMCKPGGLVFDPFAGSGSSLVAAKMLKYNYLGVELSQNYHDTIIRNLNAI